MRRLILLCLPFLIACEATPSKNPGPFERHVLDGLSINEERMPIYEQMSESKSLKISKRLIRQEKLSVGIAQVFDRRAQVYREMGIPVLVNEFVSLTEVAPLDPEARGASFEPKIFLKRENQPLVSDIERDIRKAYRKGGFEEVAQLADKQLELFKNVPQVFCMTRHFLESIRRAANYGRVHQAQAEQMGESTAWISWDFIDLHLRYLEDALYLDLQALPIQAQGISIICQDLPKISAW